MAWKEFEELKEENEQLHMLQFEAEKYAHQVCTEFPQMSLQIIGLAPGQLSLPSFRGR